MTIEEAIESLSLLRIFDEPSLNEAVKMAVIALRTQADMPPNDPLTLEELLEMDGEPVWDKSGNCFIVRINVHGTDGYGADKFATYTKLDILCKRGLYRRKPEEGGL